MNYPIAIHKESGSGYGVSVPDLPGCISVGSTIDEAMLMAREAIELHLEGLMEDGIDPPTPSEIESLRDQADYADAVWAVVGVQVHRPREVA
jgi:predicted RNase H-like HicB family nuclease